MDKSRLNDIVNNASRLIWFPMGGVVGFYDNYTGKYSGSISDLLNGSFPVVLASYLTRTIVYPRHKDSSLCTAIAFAGYTAGHVASEMIKKFS